MQYPGFNSRFSSALLTLMPERYAAAECLKDASVCAFRLYILEIWCCILYKHRGSAVTIVHYKTVINILDKKYPFLQSQNV